MPDVKKIGFQNALPDAPIEFIKFIEKILTYNPKTRYHPMDALLDPFFDEIKNSNITINNKKIVDLFNFTEFEKINYPEHV